MKKEAFAAVFCCCSALFLSITIDAAADCARCSSPKCGWLPGGTPGCKCGSDKNCKCTDACHASVVNGCAQLFGETNGKCQSGYTNCEKDCSGTTQSPTSTPSPTSTNSNTPSPTEPEKKSGSNSNVGNTPYPTGGENGSSTKGEGSKAKKDGEGSLNTDAEKKSSSALNTWQIALIIGCGILIMVIVCMVIVCCWRRTSRRLDDEEVNEADLAFYQQNYNNTRPTLATSNQSFHPAASATTPDETGFYSNYSNQSTGNLQHAVHRGSEGSELQRRSSLNQAPIALKQAPLGSAPANVPIHRPKRDSIDSVEL